MVILSKARREVSWTRGIGQRICRCRRRCHTHVLRVLLYALLSLVLESRVHLVGLALVDYCLLVTGNNVFCHSMQLRRYVLLFWILVLTKGFFWSLNGSIKCRLLKIELKLLFYDFFDRWHAFDKDIDIVPSETMEIDHLSSVLCRLCFS